MNTKELQKYIDERIKNSGEALPSIEEFNAYIADFMGTYNNSQRPDFEGYSSMEMHQILNCTFDDSSPIKLQKLLDEDYAKIPILRQIKHLIQTIQKECKIKQTSIGNIPPRIVKELYLLGIGNFFIDEGLSKLSKETDSDAVALTKILLNLMRITKVRNNVLTLTKEGEKIAANIELLMKNIMVTFCCKFNKAYLDSYESEQIGNMGVGFTLVLLSKYGSEKKPSKFYSDKYFKAFPLLLNGLVSTYTPVEHGIILLFNTHV